MEWNNIQITHFINPHKFWFKILVYDLKFIEFDINLQNYMNSCYSIGGKISIDTFDRDIIVTKSVVAYFDLKWQRWFRGTVETKSSDKEISLFLLDFGFPTVINVEHIRKIPTEMQLWNNENLKCGCLSQILPATAELDVALFDVQMKIIEEWSSKAISTVQKIITESSSIGFTGELVFNGQVLGKLYAMNAKANVKHDISKILLKLQYGVFVDNITHKLDNTTQTSVSNMLPNDYSRCSSSLSSHFESLNAKPQNLVPTTTCESNINQIELDDQQASEISKDQLSSVHVSVDSKNTETLTSSTNNNSFDCEVQLETSIKPDESSDETSGTTNISNETVPDILENFNDTCLSQTSNETEVQNSRRSIKSNNSSNGSRNVSVCSESDIDQSILSSPHLSKIFNKMRTIQNRISGNSPKVPSFDEIPPKTNNQNLLSIKSSNAKTEDVKDVSIEQNNDELTINTNIQDSINDEILEKNIEPAKSVQIPSEPLLITIKPPISVKKLHSSDDETFQNRLSESFVNSSSSVMLPKYISDNSSTRTSTIKSNDSDRYSNSADNELSPSTRENKSDFDRTTKAHNNKVYTKRLSDHGNKDSSADAETLQSRLTENFVNSSSNVVLPKYLADNSSIRTSSIKSNDSHRHSKLADNELSPSTRENKATFDETTKAQHNKVHTKRLSDNGNKDSSADAETLQSRLTESFEKSTSSSNVPLSKCFSDTSSTRTSTIKSNDIDRHSNSADNELSPSTRGNKADFDQITKAQQNKVYTKRLSDHGNKDGKLNCASNSNIIQNVRPVFRPYDHSKSMLKDTSTFYEKEQKQIVLVHGHTTINPVESFEQVNFSKDVHHALNQLTIKRLFRIDSYTWPHCLNGTSFVVIGAPKTGKTISYLPPLINSILMEEEDNCIVDSVGPVALIVAPTSEKVIGIFNACLKINQFLNNKLTICKGYGIPNDKLSMKLINGVHILISTPGCLNRLFESSVKQIDPERIKIFVVDDYHLMTDQTNLIKQIIRSSCILNRTTELYKQQIIVTSAYWFNTFMPMLKKTNNSFICIGSYMESSYYAKQDIKLLFIRQDDKIGKLSELLSNREYRLKHTLIVCRNSTEVDAIVKYLTEWNLEVIGCSRTLSSKLIIQIINNWNDQNDCVLKIVVCSDDMLPELHLTRVKVLIHFSMSSSWSKFQFRYSTFFESVPNLLKNESIETKSIVLIDETNNSELPRFIDFLKIHGVKNINPEIDHVSNEIRYQKEIDKEAQQVDFCKYILQFGVCKQQNACQYRHRFSELDKPNINLAIKKYIKFTIAYVSSPSHFYVNIIATRDRLADKWIELDKENYKVFNLKFKLYYSDKKNHMQHPKCKKGDLCTINIVDKFYRCKIDKVGEKHGVLSDRQVFVKAIDFGKKHKTTESRLLLLPDQFKTIPPKLEDMRIGGLVPIDKENKWESESTQFVENYFAKFENNSDELLEASLSFVIKDTIFVDSIVYKQDLGKFGGGELEVANFKIDMTKNKIGISDEQSFNVVKELVREADFEVFEFKIQPENEQNVNRPSSPQTEHNDSLLIIPTTAENSFLSENLNSDLIWETNISEEQSEKISSDTAVTTIKQSTMINKATKSNTKLSVTLPNKIEYINLSSFNSPLNFYVQKLSSLNAINARLFDIQEYIIESNRKKLDHFTIGDICLVFYDGYYDRAQITDICDDAIFVSLCDLGFVVKHTKNDLYEIDETIKYQPFEAIECELYGLKPIGDDVDKWDEKLIDQIYDYINDNYTDHYVKKIKEIKGEERIKFSVMLCGVNSKKGMDIINKVLVEKNWAQYTEEALDNFEECCKALVAEFDENIMSLHKTVSDEFDEESFFNSFSYEECMEMFNFPGVSMPSAKITEDNLTVANVQKYKKDAILPRATITEIVENDMTSEQSSKNRIEHGNNFIEEGIILCDNDPPPLVSCYNLLPLETLWHQDAESVTLKINVTDHSEYRIEVHKRLLNVCVQFDDETYREITINLFGLVETDNVINLIFGNYLKIVLVKTIQMNILWPRLQLDHRKLSWLRYNYDTFKEIDLKDDYIEYKIKCTDSSSDTDSDERLDEDDEFDPLSTQYNFTKTKYFDENDVKLSSS